jgi:AraC-like DNA-binding protein
VGVISGYSTRLAHISLRPYIRYYYIFQYKGNIESSKEQIVFPSGYPEALYIWGSSIAVSNEEQRNEKFEGGVVYGQLLHAQKISFISDSVVYGIVFTPLGFHRLVHEDSSSACDRITPFSDLQRELWGPFAWLSSRDEPPELGAFALRADKYLSVALSDGRPGEPPWLRSVVHQMTATKGIMQVSEFVSFANVSQRQFEGKFIDYIGCRPKQFLRALRFARFLNRCAEKSGDIIEIANECGFYDQAHLCHEVKKITGYTPLQYIETKTKLFGE